MEKKHSNTKLPTQLDLFSSVSVSDIKLCNKDIQFERMSYECNVINMHSFRTKQQIENFYEEVKKLQLI